MKSSWGRKHLWAALVIFIPVLAIAWTGIAAMAATASGPASGPTTSAATSAGSGLAGNAAQGATLFGAQGCTACHGANLEGGVGPTLNPIHKFPDVPNPLDASYLERTITCGRPAGGGYSTAMPAFGQSCGGPLSPQQIADLAAFIIQQNKQGTTGLDPVTLARSDVFWVTIGVGAMVFLTFLLSRYNMRWVARRARNRRERDNRD